MIETVFSREFLLPLCLGGILVLIAMDIADYKKLYKRLLRKNHLEKLSLSRAIYFSLLLAFLMPGLAIISTNNSGTIGDTIGGMAGPIINICAMILVYRTFTEQNTANKKQQQFFEDQKIETHDQQLFNFIYQEIKEISLMIESFTCFDSSGKGGISKYIETVREVLQDERFPFGGPDKEQTEKIGDIFKNLQFLLFQIEQFKDKNSIYYFMSCEKLWKQYVNHFPENLRNLDSKDPLLEFDHNGFKVWTMFYVKTEIYKLSSSVWLNKVGLGVEELNKAKQGLGI